MTIYCKICKAQRQATLKERNFTCKKCQKDKQREIRWKGREEELRRKLMHCNTMLDYYQREKEELEDLIKKVG